MTEIFYFDANGAQLHSFTYNDILIGSRVFDRLEAGYISGPAGWMFAELWDCNQIKQTITNPRAA